MRISNCEKNAQKDNSLHLLIPRLLIYGQGDTNKISHD